ncbi:carboxylesterase/lipase family protein [Sphingobacterium paludis]|uniref:Carboxylic ester hydrolase n=1 Tax=Sphingobacterium paludis TaxID=1476465 RepID=A0A4V3E2I4_9SPHI|nr:carboxylesterase family protein [Sphingobacterium paludis]TDS17318.1 para-nitrobenzyl esterase [Sphingobacterium paludis]
MGKIIIGVALLYATMLGSQCTVVKNNVAARPKVSTPLGVLEGIQDGDVEAFKGIPYAAAPVGPLRWRAPQAVTPWAGIRDASKFCDECAQVTWPYDAGKIKANTSEDCLYINLWRPAKRSRGKRLPVMVWIHGGSFVGGGSSDTVTSGAAFARQGVILASINYRLGRFGHFAFPALSAEHPEEPKGSYAHMDQIAALQWIKNNIASFGGDPNNVTIFGESAGGLSIHSLLTIPAAKGLFHKAIIQSAGGRNAGLTGRPIQEENADPHHPVSAQTIGINFARSRGIQETDAAALAQLRALPFEQVVGGGEEIYSPKPHAVSTYAGPIVDGKLVVETPEQAYATGRQSKVPLLIGFNSAEILAGVVNAQSKEELFSKFAPYSEEAKKAYDPEGNRTLEALLPMVNTDKGWAEPSRFTARSFTTNDSDAFVYLFDYVQTAFRPYFPYGAFHTTEIPFVFNNLPGGNGVKLTETDKQVAAMMNTYWANFAKNGDPNRSGLPRWEKHDAGDDTLLEIRSDGTASSRPDPSKLRLNVIENTIPTWK